MSLFFVDQEKCNKDGICAAECPLRLIELNDPNQVPTPIEGAEELCINCGHCVAVCPSAALTRKNMKPEECRPIRKDWVLEPEKLEHFLKARRSIRTYYDRAVDRETLTKLIETARFAPSGHNSQPVNWMVIYDGDKVRQLAAQVVDWLRCLLKKKSRSIQEMHLDRVVNAWDDGVDSVCRSAPHVIIAHALKDDPTSQAACAIALTYLELGAASFGLGTCWAGFFNVAATVWQPMRRSLELPDGHVCFGSMMIGFPRYKYHRLPLRNEANIIWR